MTSFSRIINTTDEAFKVLTQAYKRESSFETFCIAFPLRKKTPNSGVVVEVIVAHVFVVADSDVLFQITTPCERRLAIPTSIRRVIGMDVQVEFQIRELVEGLVAQSAAVGLFTGVNQEVIAQVAFLVKPFSAHLANELLLFAVRANVRLQRGGAIERLLTDVAFVRLVAGVDNFVTAQSA